MAAKPVQAILEEEALLEAGSGEPRWEQHDPMSGTIGCPKNRRERAVALCEAMIDVTAALFSVSGKEMRRSGRTGLDVARVRQIAMYVTHTILGVSMKEVGRGFGRDRTTVLHACHLIEDLRDDEEFDRHVVMVERVALAAFRDRLEQ